MSDAQQGTKSPTADFEDFKDYLAINDETSRIVAEVKPILLEHLDEIVQGFYQRMRLHVDAMARFPGGEEQLARQEVALRRWLNNLLEDAGMLESGEAQVRIGTVHLAAAVNEELMIAAMNWLRTDMARVLRRSDMPGGLDHVEAINAINKLLDYNLGLILTSYWRVLQERVTRADRLILIGQYTAAINHELRNPLGVIGTSNYLLRKALGEAAEEKVTRHLDKIDRSLERANSIIAGLMRLIRVEQPHRDRVDLKRFLRDQEENLFIPGTIDMEFKAEFNDRENAMFDATQLGQVIENLVRNAIEAMEGKGRLELELINGSAALDIIVRDSGPGIPSTVRKQIFDPLFSTKSFGTGLGLTLSKAIIEAHGGAFEIVEGLAGRGVGFRIRIPHYMTPA